MTKHNNKLMVECVNAHQFCRDGHECPYCEPVRPLRYEDGTFASVEDTARDVPAHKHPNGGGWG